jgi:HEAT repeat protein
MFASNSASVLRVAPSTDLQELVLSSLLHAVQRDPSFRVKQSAAWALGKIKSFKVLNGLKQYLLEIEALPSRMKDGLDVNSSLYTVKEWIKEAIKAIEK